LSNLVRLARRRLLTNELITQGANATTAALGAFILLLLLGSEILNWQIVAAVPLAALVVGLYLVRRRLPSPYVTAQIVDRRMELSDTISTALFFAEVKPDAQVSAEIREAQLAHAGRAAAGVDVRQAVPFVVPRAAYAAAVLLVAAAGLFALRYGIERRLDLRRPLANFLPDSFTNRNVRQAQNQRRNPKQVPQVPDENGISADDQTQQGPGAEDPTQQIQSPESDSANAKSDAKSQGGKKAGEQQADDQMATDDQDPNNDGNAGQQGDDNQNGQQGDNKKDGGKQQGNKQDANANNDSSMMSKMKDAFQNLMSRLKPQSQQGNQQGSQEQQAQPGKSQQGSKQQNSKEGQPQPGQQGDAQEGEDGQESKNAENAQQSKGQGKSDSQQTSKQPGSGIGSQDGDKAIKNAEQLAAMGKISEILGKRSANLTGEATVEVQSTSQQLRTPYAAKPSQHTQGGAEINRDEVPVALQPMVQQYFEQIRKQAPAPAPAGSGGTDPAGSSGVVKK
jgi:hypothetical protein